MTCLGVYTPYKRATKGGTIEGVGAEGWRLESGNKIFVVPNYRAGSHFQR